MYTRQPKKLLIINILDILRKYSDENHRLSQKDIVTRLETEYMMKADRKSVKRNLSDLRDCGLEIECTERRRTGTGGEEETICTDWYLVRDFTDAELRLIIDSLLFFRHVPEKQRTALIGKLRGLSSRYFAAKVGNIRGIQDGSGNDKQLFYTIDILDEAIAEKRKVMFYYTVYGADKLRHVKTDSKGNPLEYTVSPYQMAAVNGFYYLICNVDGHGNAVHFRVDRISGISQTEVPSKPERTVTGLENGLCLPEHMAEHVYMFSGESVRVLLRADIGHLDEVFDWFGTGVTVTNVTADTADISFTANRNAVRYWAIQYGSFVELLEPADLREETKRTLTRILKRYE